MLTFVFFPSFFMITIYCLLVIKNEIVKLMWVWIIYFSLVCDVIFIDRKNIYRCQEKERDSEREMCCMCLPQQTIKKHLLSTTLDVNVFFRYVFLFFFIYSHQKFIVIQVMNVVADNFFRLNKVTRTAAKCVVTLFFFLFGQRQKKWYFSNFFGCCSRSIIK